MCTDTICTVSYTQFYSSITPKIQGHEEWSPNNVRLLSLTPVVGGANLSIYPEAVVSVAVMFAPLDRRVFRRDVEGWVDTILFGGPTC